MYCDSAIYIISADMHSQLTTTSAKCMDIVSALLQHQQLEVLKKTALNLL